MRKSIFDIVAENMDMESEEDLALDGERNVYLLSIPIQMRRFLIT